MKENRAETAEKTKEISTLMKEKTMNHQLALTRRTSLMKQKDNRKR
jgi:hypothetical protein